MRLLKRGLLTLGIAVVTIVSALAISIPVDGFLNRNRVATLTNVVITGSDTDVLAYLIVPDSEEPLPAVIMIHEFWGLKPEIIGKAEALAAEGYVVIAPDTMRGQTTSWIPKAIWQTIRTPREQINADLDSVFRYLSQLDSVDASRIMVMGFCYGGRAALQYSLHNPMTAATGVFYGSSLVTDADELSRLSGPVLGIFGSEDTSIPLSEVAAFEAGLQAAGIPHEVTVYEGVGHAFVTSIEGIANDPVQAEAWQQFLDFLRRYL
jgi:carboxymethylenebutenolidase